MEKHGADVGLQVDAVEVEGKRADAGCRGRSYAGQGHEVALGHGHLAAGLADGLRGTVHRQGATVVAQALPLVQDVGWLCGGSLSKDSLKLFSKLLPLTLAFVAFLIGTCALAAWPLTAWLDISYFEGYLATTPGAIDTVLALTSESGAGAVVVSMQVIRLLTILVFASYLPQFLRFYRRIIR